MRKLSLAAFLILLLNSAYLFSFGEPTLFYISNVLLHVGFGIVLILPFCIYTYKKFKRVSKLGQIGSIGIAIGIITGVYLMIVGATTPYRWLLITHIISVSLGSLLFCIYLLRDAAFLTPLLRKITGGVLAIVVLSRLARNSHNTIYPTKPTSLKTRHSHRQACTKKAAARLDIFSPHPLKQKRVR